MAFTETATDFIDTDEHAVASTIDGDTVNGILNRDYAEINGVESEVWSFLVAVADVPNVRHGANVVIGGNAYYVVNRQQMDSGMFIKLMLAEA